MTLRAVAAVVAGIAGAAMAVLLFTGGPESAYRVKLLMPSAYGLRENTDVRVGGVSVGKVDTLRLTDDDQVSAELLLDDEAVTVGSRASVNILSVNLLGEKYLELDPGNAERPLASGSVIGASRVTPSVDLDQILNVLDTDTRTRMAVLINEAGRAVTGRGADFNELLRKLPGGLGQARELLDEVVADNHTLGELIDRSDSFLARMETQKEDLGVFVDSARAAAATFATRSAELRETLRRAPRGLATLERFLAQLRVTAGPLGPAARTLTGTAPALTSTLAALPAFRREARPTLLAAVQAAPLLTQLADGATPVIDRSLPTLASLNGFATTAVPATATLGRSIDDLLGVLEGWGRATSARDGLSHVFHGRVVVGPDAVRQLVNSVKPTRRAAARRKRRPATPPAITAPASRPPAPRPTGPAAPPLATKPLLGQVEGLVQGLVGALPRVQTPLLDYLLKP